MLMIEKQASGKGFEVRIPDGTCAWVGDTKAECLTIVQAVAPLLDWSTITTCEAFDVLPVETRKAIGLAGHEAKESHRDAVKAAKLAKQAEADKLNAVYAAGVPWSEAPKGTPAKLEKRIPATYNGMPWITDGYVALAGLHNSLEDRQPAKMDQIVPDTLGLRVEPVAYYQLGKGYRFAVLSNGGTVNADFIALFTKTFPGCEFRTAGKLLPVTVHSCGTIVGLFMPVNQKDSVIPAYIAGVVEKL